MLQKSTLEQAAPMAGCRGAQNLAILSLTLCAKMTVLSSSMTSSLTLMNGAQTAFAQTALPRDAGQMGGSRLAQMGATSILQANLGKTLFTTATRLPRWLTRSEYGE